MAAGSGNMAAASVLGPMSSHSRPHSQEASQTPTASPDATPRLLELTDGFALRMGETRLSPFVWKLKPNKAGQLIKAPREQKDEDFALDIGQKGVDIRIGLDMARLALRDMVKAVAVVTGDSDFVPAFKFVRREGVKVMLCTLGHKGTRRELKAHADFVLS